MCIFWLLYQGLKEKHFPNGVQVLQIALHAQPEMNETPLFVPLSRCMMGEGSEANERITLHNIATVHKPAKHTMLITEGVCNLYFLAKSVSACTRRQLF